MQRMIVAAALLCFAVSNAALAQVNSAIGGIVQDPTQALIPGVTITAINTQTNVQSTTLTNESGAYNFAGLLPGVYKVTATLSGFSPYTYNEVELSAGAPIRLDFTLQVGATSQADEVTVSSDTL